MRPCPPRAKAGGGGPFITGAQEPRTAEPWGRGPATCPPHPPALSAAGALHSHRPGSLCWAGSPDVALLGEFGKKTLSLAPRGAGPEGPQRTSQHGSRLGGPAATQVLRWHAVRRSWGTWGACLRGGGGCPGGEPASRRILREPSPKCPGDAGEGAARADCHFSATGRRGNLE